jgi:hypothetical protein
MLNLHVYLSTRLPVFLLESNSFPKSKFMLVSQYRMAEQYSELRGITMSVRRRSSLLNHPVKLYDERRISSRNHFGWMDNGVKQSTAGSCCVRTITGGLL